MMMKLVNLYLPNSTFLLIPNFISEPQQLFDNILLNTDWGNNIIHGRTVLRQIQHYGQSYTYSGLTHPQQDIPEYLNNVLLLVNDITCENFNSILVNYYPNEKASIGWHSDNEKELGSNPNIASVSLGATRFFSIRRNKTYETISIPLQDGMLIFMGHNSQRLYQHSVQKQVDKCGPRINLTFRKIL